jgi:hypothetical protein
MNEKVKVGRKRKYVIPTGYKMRVEQVPAGFQTTEFSPDGNNVEIHSKNGQIPAIKKAKEKQLEYKMTTNKGEPLYAVVIKESGDRNKDGKQYLAYADRTPVWVRDRETGETVPFWNYSRSVADARPNKK